MKILSAPPSGPIEVVTTCKDCSCQFSFTKGEARFEPSQRDGDAYVVACPHCHTNNWVAAALFNIPRQVSLSPAFAAPYGTQPPDGTAERPFVLNIPNRCWRPTGRAENPMAALLCSLLLNGDHMHILAFEVKTDADGIHRAADPHWEGEVEAIYKIACDVGFETTDINGKRYAITMHPGS